MDKILNQILNEIKGIKNDLSDVKHELSDVKNELSDVKHEVKDLKQGQERIESKVDNVILEMRSTFNKPDEGRKVVEIVSEEIKGIKIDIDYLSSKIGKHDMQLNNVMHRLKS